MNILDLDEAQGLTPQMVREWLANLDPAIMPSACISDDIIAVSELCGETPQALLREINPRMRKGMPSEAARIAHGETKDWLCMGYMLHAVRFCWSVNDHVQMVDGTDVFSTERSEDTAMIERCAFWPCDEHGNKVRWPTDAEGKML